MNPTAKTTNDPQQARFLRRQYATQDHDSNEQQQDIQFQQNIESAIDTHSKKIKTKNLQEQIEYFGYAIEPFNMRQQEQMGEADEEGFFVFNNDKRNGRRRNQFRDAWMDSIDEGADEKVVDKIKKKIKLQGSRYKSVYQGGKASEEVGIGISGKIQQKDANQQQQQDDNEEDDQNNNEDEQSNEQNNDNKITQQQHCQQSSQSNNNLKETQLQPIQLKQLIVQLLPTMNKSANQYIKQLKKTMKNIPENKQLHDHLIDLTQIYIDKTGEYDILTKKKEVLQMQIGENDEKENGYGQRQQSSVELNWDNQDDQEDNDQNDKNNDNKKCQNNLNGQKKTNKKRVTFQIPQNDNNKNVNSDNDNDDDIF